MAEGLGCWAAGAGIWPAGAGVAAGLDGACCAPTTVAVALGAGDVEKEPPDESSSDASSEALDDWVAVVPDDWVVVLSDALVVVVDDELEGAAV